MSPTQRVWERLAELLVQQRGRIDSNARRFADSTRLNHRLIYDIEHARRTNYRPAKLAEIEHAYRLRTGVIADFLEGHTETLEPDGAGGHHPAPRRVAAAGRYRAHRRASAAAPARGDAVAADPAGLAGPSGNRLHVPVGESGSRRRRPGLCGIV